MHEKRRHPRKKYYQFADHSDGLLLTESAMSDISANGMFIRTRNRPPVGAEIFLNFKIMDQPIEIAAEVVRHDMRGFGVEFLPESAEEQTRIEDLLKQMSLEKWH